MTIVSTTKETKKTVVVNDHLYWGALPLVNVAFGPGRFSLDYWLSKR